MTDNEGKDEIFLEKNTGGRSPRGMVSYRSSKRMIRRILLCLMILCAFWLFNFINAYAVNNPTWLEGTWSYRTEQYSIETKNEDLKKWDIKQNGFILMENAKIAESSSKGNIILTREGSQTEYHISKIDKEHMRLHIYNNKKKIKTMNLQRVK